MGEILKQGGKREGAGRPRKFAQYQEATERIRVPASLVDDVYRFIDPEIRIPLFASQAPAGFVSPADDYIERTFTVKELTEYFMEQPAATFLVRISGWSMRDAGIHDGSIVICNRSLTPCDGDVVLAAVDGEVTCKRLRILKDGVMLVPENSEFQPIKVADLSELMIWGVVTGNFNLHRSSHSSKPNGKHPPCIRPKSGE